MLGELKKFRAQTILVFNNKKIDDPKTMRKVFQLCAKLIVNDSDIDKIFGSMNESIMTNFKKSVSEDEILETTVEYTFKISQC